MDWILPKLSTAGFVIRHLCNNLKNLKMAYISWFIYQIWNHILGRCSNSCNVFRLQARLIRIMSGAEPRSSYRGLFRKFEILPVPCQYILSLMLFIIDNANHFQTGLEIHGNTCLTSY